MFGMTVRFIRFLRSVALCAAMAMVTVPAMAWCPEAIQFIYYNTCDSSTMHDSWCTYGGEVGTFKENTTFTCGDKTFIGWNTQEDGKGQTYQPGETIPSDLTEIYAQWLSVSPMVNVKYIHQAIAAKWGINIAYHPNLKNERAAANMRYLMGMIDVANKRLGGTDKRYGDSIYATSYAASKNTVDKAVATLIKPKPKTFPFTATTTSDTTSFSFGIGAAGEFWVDWGDGSDVETITKTSTSSQTISHTYTTAAAYDIRIGGAATKYSTSSIAAISFRSNKNLAGISGSLGAIFPTLANGSQPIFYATFSSCTNLTGSIPENLFAGIKGRPASYMFYETFGNCKGLTGEIPENLFAGISGAPAQSMFRYTFSGCSGLTGEIPENLFAGISGAPAESMFDGTFSSCTGLTSIPENLFAGISGAPASEMFNYTFYNCSGLTGEIPGNLFAGIKGRPASKMFNYTFSDCTGLTSIPEGLFAGISGAPASDMFNGTFWRCSGLTGSIPAGLFGNLSGAPADSMFSSTFSGCSGLTGSIPAGLFGNLSGAPADSMFSSTFSGCSGLTGSIPENLFAGISGKPAHYMFSGTFARCTGLTSIPENLFSGIRGAPASRMFDSTFSGCSGLTGEIPENLFAGISGAPAESMFDGTFSSCTGLTSIPENLFAGISGAPASEMFNYTFYNCSGLTGSIPAGLFGNISGAPASNMFRGTFYNCSGLTGEIPSGLFGSLSGTPVWYMFSDTFYNCKGLTGEIPLGLFGNLSGTPNHGMFFRTFYGCSGLVGKSARNPDGTYLYDVFPTATSQVGDMYTGTCLYDNASIPSAWGGKACTYTGPIPSDEVTDFPFSVTTVPNTSEFALMLGATGDFTIDWGDGNVETVSPTNRTVKTHTYSNAGTYTIKLAGLATGKAASSQTTRAAGIGPWSVISFSEEDTGTKCNIASMSGSLGKIFPMTWTDGGLATFMATFAGCANLTNISETLFDGVTSSDYSSMFAGTFSGTGIIEIPAGLFASINGATSEQMFVETFRGCTNLTSIPQGLFDGVTVDAKTGYDAFAGTFYGCTALTGPSAQMSDGTYLYDIANFGDGVGYGMYIGCTGLDDYATMPDYLKEE